MASLPQRFAGAASLAVLLCLLACMPVLAHNATEMGVAPDQFDLGIPVYWPDHAALMTLGFISLVSGFVVMRYRRTRSWFSNHRRLQMLGGVAVIAGLSMSIYMVQLSGAPHLREIHGVLGGGTIAVVLATLALGLVITRAPGVGPLTRRAHRRMGGAAIALVAVNIALGLAMMPSVLAQ